MRLQRSYLIGLRNIMLNSVNNINNNLLLPELTQKIAKWHHDRNLVEGATNWSQTKKLFEEFIEVVAAQMPGQSPEVISEQISVWAKELYISGRIKSVSVEDAADALHDGIGDMYVVMTNLSEREQVPLSDMVDYSYQEIKHRKGKMIGGTFVKESDLPPE